MSVGIREATPDDSLGVRRVLDAAMLDVRDDLETRIETGDVLVAAEGGPILGALVLVPRTDGARVDAVAVRRARRGRGLGTRLVQAAAERVARRPLVAEFDPSVRPFYESLGFEVSSVGEGRLRGVFEVET
ncbi:GNAT family N-acetyltransferase [Halorussus amylolyticus]|uniref:GNAT family N-acetyltransferase n=1 Tax=Halorussus amylolyticus TaxID=1126242 RepID=UPI00105251BF|nr:GNAT family N-acetyltransferase [Halorussus amylolyticus]